MPVAAAVVSWNTRDLLARCLRSLGDVDDVWVVDNASSDGSADMVRTEFPGVHLIASDRNLGFGSAVNLVAARTDAPWLLVANADVALEPGALEALLSAGARDPGAGALAPRLRLPDGSTQHSVFPFPTVPFSVAFNLGLTTIVPGLARRLVLEGHWDPDVPRRVPWAIGALLAVRRAAWDEIGGFDERQFLYAEDLDLGWRLHRAGWATRYVPEAIVLHEGSAATRQAWGDGREARAQRMAYRWMLRRRGAVRTRVTAALNVLGARMRWLALTPIAVVKPSGIWAYRRERQRRWARAHMAGLLLDCSCLVRWRRPTR